MRNKKIKYIISIFLLVCLIIYIYDNLHSNSPYYASQLNKSNEYNEVIFLIRDLEYINKPSSDKYLYDYDGQNILVTSEYKLSISFIDEKEYIYYSSYISDNDYGYHLDNQLDVIDIVDYSNNYEYLPVTEEIQEEVRNQILEDIQPIMDLQNKPIINLQWIFNIFYANSM